MAFVSTNYELKRKDDCDGKIVKYTEKDQVNLNLYQDPPTEVITLQEFEQFGRERMKVLKKIENIREKYRQGSKEYIAAFKDELKTLMPLATGVLRNEHRPAERRKDRISHFILRMAFCQNAEQSKWFIQQELELFRTRFSLEPESEIMKFLRVNNLDLEHVSVEEKRQFMKQLTNVHKCKEEVIEKTEFWKVEFTRAFELVRGRKVFLWNGMLYITSKEIIAVVATRLRMIMSKAMAKEASNMCYLNEDERLLPMLRRMSKYETNSSYTKPKNPNEITPQMIDELSKTSFPPCMRQIHSHLRQDHHLRHFARRQYGLFLKDAGMSLQSSLEFFRKEFTKKVDVNKFDKEYAYNIRHMYGKEGSHREGASFPCTTIILTNPPSAQDCHGCPFKHCEAELLAQRLELMGLTKDQANKVKTLSKMSQFDKACARTFEFQHKMDEGALGTVITHPNQYFELSRQIYDGKRSREVKASQEIQLTLKRDQHPNDGFDEPMDI